MSLERFFSRYAELSLGPQPEELADLYAPTFIVGGPHGSQAFANDARFVEWLRQVANFNRHGMRSHGDVDSRRNVESTPHTLATVTWGARFEKTGDRIIEFEISYCSRRPRTSGESRSVPNLRRAGRWASHLTPPARSNSISHRGADADGSRPHVASARSRRSADSRVLGDSARDRVDVRGRHLVEEHTFDRPFLTQASPYRQKPPVLPSATDQARARLESSLGSYYPCKVAPLRQLG